MLKITREPSVLANLNTARVSGSAEFVGPVEISVVVPPERS